MNPLQKKTKWETMSYIAKYMSIGILLYIVVPYAWKTIRNSTKKTSA